jgi:hypothetical protein
LVPFSVFLAGLPPVRLPPARFLACRVFSMQSVVVWLRAHPDLG